MYSIFHKKIMLKPPYIYIYIYARLHGSGSRGGDYGCWFGSSRSRGCTGAHKLNHGPVRVVACGITEVRQKCTCVSQETLLRDKIAICGNIDHCYNKVKVSTQFLAMVRCLYTRAYDSLITGKGNSLIQGEASKPPKCLGWLKRKVQSRTWKGSIQTRRIYEENVDFYIFFKKKPMLLVCSIIVCFVFR